MRRHDSLRALLTSLFVACLLAAVLPPSESSFARLGRSSAITKRATQFNSSSPAEIKSHRNDADSSQAISWFGGFLSIALDNRFSTYAYSLHQEPLPQWNQDAGHGRSPPSSLRFSQL